MKIKNILKENFYIKYLITIYHCFMSWLMPKLIDDKKAVIRFYRKKSNGKTLDLENPITFSQKQQWYKLYVKDRLMERCADKLSVREYVKEMGYEEHLNELLGIYSTATDIDLHLLPDKFVIKASHGSGFNIIVKDKTTLKWKQVKLLLNSWLRQNIAWSGREWVYYNMPRYLIIEKYLEDETGELRDFKFFCFNGVPKFMQLEIGRFAENNIRNFYDMNWNLLPFGKEISYNPNIAISKPLMFEKMKQMAEDLCKPFQFVRVDLYQVGTKVYFGELTFFPASGAPDFIPPEYDEIVGSMWELKGIARQ